LSSSCLSDLFRGVLGRRSGWIAGTLVLGWLAVGCSPAAPGPQQVSLKGAEFSFSPASINVKAGQTVQLTLQNTGALDHDFKSDLPISNLVYQEADNEPDEQQENSRNGVMDVDFDKGQSARVTFTPTKAGTYTFYCDVQGHREAGMQGTIVVS
jgi:uncharacterized cupredoxin-like copper-binding protein